MISGLLRFVVLLSLVSTTGWAFGKLLLAGHPWAEMGFFLFAAGLGCFVIQERYWVAKEEKLREKYRLLELVRRRGVRRMSPEEVELLQIGMMQNLFSLEETVEIVNRLVASCRGTYVCASGTEGSDCLYYNNQDPSLLRCAVNPTGECRECGHFAPKP